MLDFEELAQRHASKTRQNQSSSNHASDGFSADFERFKQDVLDPVAQAATGSFQATGSQVQVVTSPAQSRFYTAQLVFFNSKIGPNVLRDPYVLVEGYPADGKVRIAVGKSSEQGEILDITNHEEEGVLNQQEVVSSHLARAITRYLDAA